MRAVYVEAFGQRPVVRDVPDPVAAPDGVVVRVETAGLCRSDIHAWLGHDHGVELPLVPGHELVGVIESVGAQVARFTPGQRVTTPFVCACGRCPECASGNAQVCRNQTQPGFTHWGAFGELVALRHADVNLIAVPAGVERGVAALLGCRFATAFRALVQQASVRPGEWVVVIGCGGVGLSCVMIAAARGAHVLALDVSPAALAHATRLGAAHALPVAGRAEPDVLAAIRAVTGGLGADVTVDALGQPSGVRLGVQALAPRGRHVQIGLLAQDPVVPLGTVIARELTILGSHGMAAADYPELLAAVASGSLRPQDVIDRRIGLEDVPDAMVAMSREELAGVTVIDLV